MLVPNFFVDRIARQNFEIGRFCYDEQIEHRIALLQHGARIQLGEDFDRLISNHFDTRGEYKNCVKFTQVSRIANQIVNFLLLVAGSGLDDIHDVLDDPLCVGASM